jgi:non-ribosomal peptide synthetase component F
MGDLPVGRSDGSAALFDITVNYQFVDTDISEIKSVAGLDIEMVIPRRVPAKYALSFNLIESARAMSGFLEFNESVFPARNVERMRDHFLIVLERLEDNLYQRVSDFPLLSAEEKEWLADRNHHHNPNYDDRLTVNTLFSRQAAHNPGLPACRSYTGESLTYGQLDNLTNKLAHFLKTLKYDQTS